MGKIDSALAAHRGDWGEGFGSGEPPLPTPWGKKKGGNEIITLSVGSGVGREHCFVYLLFLSPEDSNVQSRMRIISSTLLVTICH